MNDNYPRMKNFFYWHRPNIILSIPIYEYLYVIHCQIVIECFAIIYTLVFNDALKKTSACMSRRS